MGHDHGPVVQQDLDADPAEHGPDKRLQGVLHQ
eukprot:CAMPEP_0198560840 /NCGR_PEP_ID=MMETSP1462-20131121/94538_1 /TAXON_ID=1333877 /ORGANISM="Brandtodinium nutriculum, Strain RCC3387" /LENGTH=32 /DNA_ID= /DNA_START= /DNA_END= /DNA_ORIENTATION=